MSNKATKITQSDLKFYPSERLDDTDEGGGMPLGTPIKGEANEIFSPISSIERVNGGFDNVLIYGGVQRADKEPLIGAFTAITKPPADPAVSYLLFGAGFGELRRDAIKRIENYNSATIESPMTLLSNPARGSRIIQAYQRVGEKLPSIGDVYCLSQDKNGYPKIEQYVQLVKVEATERTFVSMDGKEFVRMVMKMEISQALIHDFVGVDYPVERYADAPTKIRETHVADAAVYYGVKPLAQAVQKGLSTIKVSSIMEKMVPTAQVETPFADVPASRLTPVLFDGASSSVTLNTTSQGNTVYLYPFMPNSLNTANGISDQNGKLLQDGQEIGEVNYAQGVLKFTQSTSVLRPTFRPAVVHTPFSDTYRIDINLQNRSYNHIITLPNIGISSLTVSYMAQGKWYELTDNGTGVLLGASSEHGSGSVNYRTGTVSITTGLMPDVDSSIIFNVGNHATLQKVTDISAYFVYELEQTPNFDTLTVDNIKASKAGKWATGFVKDKRLYSTQKVNQIRYNAGQRQSATITAPTLNADGYHHLNLSDTPISGVELMFALSVMNGQEATDTQVVQRLYDNGNGQLVDGSGNVAGLIDYDNALAKIKPTQTIYTSKPTYRTETYSVRKGGRLFGPKYVTHTRQIFDGFGAKAKQGLFNTQLVQASFYDNSQGTQITQNITSHALAIETSATLGVVFMVDGKPFFIKDGSIYNDQNVKVGTHYIPDWQGSNAVQLISGAKHSQSQTVDEVSFRTPVAPIRLSSLQVRATLTDGTAVSAVADNDGNLDSEWITGRVDAKHGVVTVSFGKMVDKAPQGDETVTDGKVWQPANVIADSVVYNAVGMSHLPIDATTVKVDTVRLPSDGLIPIFRRGDTVLIGNRQTQNIGSAHTAGQTVQLDRTNLDRICVMDAKDKPVLATLWDYDLDAGTITWQTPLDLSGYELPLKVMHVIEEKNRVIDVDIDGTLSLMFPIKNSYEPDGTYVSSVLIGGDLAVRHSIPFTQSNWDNVWRDTPNGEQLLNRLNVKDYPIVLTDDGAITERWLIKFTSGSQFELYGETLGFVLKTDTLQDLAPINPATQKPYFTIPKEAFGGAQGQAPWQTQNVIRFNTTGTLLPMWIIRAVQPTSEPQEGDDGFGVCLFGDTTEI